MTIDKIKGLLQQMENAAREQQSVTDAAIHRAEAAMERERSAVEAATKREETLAEESRRRLDEQANSARESTAIYNRLLDEAAAREATLQEQLVNMRKDVDTAMGMLVEEQRIGGELSAIVDKTQTLVDDLEKKLDSERAAVANLTDTLRVANSSLEEKTARVADLEQGLDSLRGRLSAKDERIQEDGAELTTLRAKLSLMEDDLAAAKVEGPAVMELRQELEKAVTARNELAMNLHQTVDKLAATTAERDALQKSIDEKKAGPLARFASLGRKPW